ncbi:unannotated protein [freshwater metagenome]|uniref:Unannotated protein n=1 Tax=freshwater metagenome TaxID=449393 RepID=A0A6J6HGX9_9ZZZZ
MNVPTLHGGELCWIVILIEVQYFAPCIPHVTQYFVTHWNAQSTTSVAHGSTATQTVSWLEANGADSSITKLLSNFGQDLNVFSVDAHGELECRVQFGERTPWELDVDNRTGNTDDPSVF